MLFFSLYFLIFFVVYLFINLSDKIQSESVIAEQEKLIQFGSNIIETTISSFAEDMFFLVEDFRNENSSEEIIKTWTSFIKNEISYDQIRFIDRNGFEKIKINKSKDGAYIVPASELQNKSNKNYFSSAINLSEREVYFSQINLNIENEGSNALTIQAASPYFDKDNTLQGIIVLDFHVQNMLDILKNLVNSDNSRILYLSSDGDYIINETDSSKEWNFRYGNFDDGFSTEFSKEWKFINAQKSGSFYTENGYFTFINLHRENENSYLVMYVPPDSPDYAVFSENFFMQVYYSYKEFTFAWLTGTGVLFLLTLLLAANKVDQQKIKYYSEFDAETNTYNRRSGITKIENLAKREQEITICFIDINGLKEVNDTLGHVTGDELIKTVVQVISNNIGQNDIVVRMGGDEFLIAFIGSMEEQAEFAWKQICYEIDIINENENRKYLVSASHGIANFSEKQKEDIQHVIGNADEKMYKEKQRIKKGLKIIR